MKVLATCILFILLASTGYAGEERPLFRIIKNGLWGYIDASGSIIVPPTMTVPEPLGKGPRWKRDGKLWGLAAADGAWLAAPAYKTTHGESDGYFLGERPDGEYELLTSSGKVEEHFGKLSGSTYLSDGFIHHYPRTPENSGVALWTTDGRTVRESLPEKEPEKEAPPYDMNKASIIPFPAFDRWGYRDRNANVLIPPQFEKALWFRDGLAPAKISGLWGYIDPHGNWVVPPRFEMVSIYGFAEGLAAAKQNGKWGFIDKSGEFKIKPVWDGAKYFSEGRAPVAKLVGSVDNNNPDRWGAIDREGKVVIRPRFDEVTPFEDGYTMVLESVSSGYFYPLDKNGKPFAPKDWMISDYGDKYWTLNSLKDKKKALYDVYARKIVYMLQNAEELRAPVNGLSWVLYERNQEKDSFRYGYLDLSGRPVFEALEKGNPYPMPWK